MKIDFPVYPEAAGFGGAVLYSSVGVMYEDDSIQPQALQSAAIRKEFPETWLWLSINNNDRFVKRRTFLENSLHQRGHKHFSAINSFFFLIFLFLKEPPLVRLSF